MFKGGYIILDESHILLISRSSLNLHAKGGINKLHIIYDNWLTSPSCIDSDVKKLSLPNSITIYDLIVIVMQICKISKFYNFQMLGPCYFTQLQLLTWIWARDRLHDDLDSLPTACQKKRLNPRGFHQKNKPDPQIVWTEPKDCFQRELHLDWTPNLFHQSLAEHCLCVVEELGGCLWAGPEKRAWMRV